MATGPSLRHRFAIASPGRASRCQMRPACAARRSRRATRSALALRAGVACVWRGAAVTRQKAPEGAAGQGRWRSPLARAALARQGPERSALAGLGEQGAFAAPAAGAPARAQALPRQPTRRARQRCALAHRALASGERRVSPAIGGSASTKRVQQHLGGVYFEKQAIFTFLCFILFNVII